MKRIRSIQMSLLFLVILFLTQNAQAQLPIDFSKIDSTETLKSCQAMLQNFVSARKATAVMEQNFTRKGITQAFIPIPGGKAGLMDVYLYYFVMADEKRIFRWTEFFTQNSESNQRTGSFRMSNAIPVQEGCLFQLQIETNSLVRNRRLSSNELQMIASNPGNLLVFGFN